MPVVWQSLKPVTTIFTCEYLFTLFTLYFIGQIGVAVAGRRQSKRMVFRKVKLSMKVQLQLIFDPMSYMYFKQAKNIGL